MSALGFGREICGDLAAAERREWLCTNGVGGFASGTVAGLLSRRYHGLLIAALEPPLGRTLLVAGVDETVAYDDLETRLSTSRWADGTVDPRGYRQIERFDLDGTTPVWTYAVTDALVEKRIWMEQGENTTYVRYRILRTRKAVALELKVFVDYRDYHGTTHGDGWRMNVTPIAHGLRVIAFDGARPLRLLADRGDATPAHTWYRNFDLAAERARGLEAAEDHLHAATFRAALDTGEALTLVLSAEGEPSLDGGAAWSRRARHDAEILDTWRRTEPVAESAPSWIDRLVLAADQFVVRRPPAADADGMTVIAGYHWFGDWGRDTMIALPGLALSTGRPDVARRILKTFARLVDRGMVPNRLHDGGRPPEYNAVDATLWYVEAIRAYHEAMRDDALLEELFPLLAEIIQLHAEGTRYGIRVDADGLLTAGAPGVQLTWMDAKVDDWVVTPRHGKAVEVNALWFNALRSMAGFARQLGRSSDPWETLGDRATIGFARFWNERAGHCYDVIDGPSGHDDALRPNQIFAVSLRESPLSLDRQRQVVDACSRRLLTSYGLRSLAPDHPQYRGRYGGDRRARDGAYHQGTVWGWLLGPFALAHFRVHRDASAARSFLAPLAAHLADAGLGSISEIFDGDPPFTPAGCIAQAWSVGETLRAWHVLSAARPGPRYP